MVPRQAPTASVYNIIFGAYPKKRLAVMQAFSFALNYLNILYNILYHAYITMHHMTATIRLVQAFLFLWYINV